MELYNMKQTAVEWLINELGIVEYEGLPQPEWIKHLISKAKKIEKNQIMQAWLITKPITFNSWKKEFEQYYNETFKK
jgi:hypothetical protein